MTQDRIELVECLKCDHNQCSIGDELHRDFKAADKIDWCEVANYGREINNLLAAHSDEVEVIGRDDIQDHLLFAVAAQAAHGAFAAVGTLLGLSAEAIELAVTEYYWDKKSISPISAAEFIQKARAPID